MSRLFAQNNESSTQLLQEMHRWHSQVNIGLVCELSFSMSSSLSLILSYMLVDCIHLLN